MNKKEIIKLTNISKTYHTKEKDINVLKDISITFEKGKFYAIMGHSGSGKTTLLNILGLVDKADSGTYLIDGKELNPKDEVELSKIRMNKMGFIFQDIYLNDHLKAIENVMLPMLINKDISVSERKPKAMKLLEEMELTERVNHFPKELSGGEQQRIGIARALANEPLILLADEPTGNLDESTEKNIFDILKRLSNEEKCIIVVSHSNEVKKYADFIYKLEDGKLIEEKTTKKEVEKDNTPKKEQNTKVNKKSKNKK